MIDIAGDNGHQEIVDLLTNLPPTTAQQDLCAARQRLALAVDMANESHALIYPLPFDLLRLVCEEAHVLLRALLPLDRPRHACELLEDIEPPAEL
jgi:hypothetical protein